MYLWKAWHDHRGRFAIYAAAVTVLGVIVGMEALHYYRVNELWFQEYMVRRAARTRGGGFMGMWRIWAPENDLYSWVFAGNTLMFYLGWLTVWLGLAFGSTTIGRHLRPGSAEFLLTRPEPRRRAVWSEWGLSVAGLLVIFFMPLLVTAAFLLRIEGRVHEPRFFIIGCSSFLVAAAVFGLTQFMTTLTSSGLKGLNFSVAAILIYGMLPTALNEWWHWYAPQRWQDWTFEVFNFLQWGRGDVFPPLGSFLYWGVLAVTFPVMTHLLLRRREV